MSGNYLLSQAHTDRIKPCFPRARSVRVDDLRVVSGIFPGAQARAEQADKLLVGFPSGMACRKRG